MDTDALTPSLLRELRAPRPYPAVSLTMPTHRRPTEQQQDAIRLRNLVTEAERRLETDPRVSRQDQINVKAQLEQAVEELDPRQALDGLLISATAQEFQVWRLPRTVPERVIFDETYLTRNLVAARAQSRPFWALVVSADRAILWSGIRERVHQENTGGFPMTAPEDEFDVQRVERVGNVPSTFRDERTRQFLRAVDDALGAVLKSDPRPLYLVGLAPVLAALEEVGEHSRAAVGRVPKGGLTDASPAELLKELQPAIDEYQQREMAEIAARLDEARGRRTSAAGLDEVWTAVREGRAGTVVVEEHFQRAALATDPHLRPVTTEEAESAAAGPQMYEDIVDELVETALDKGADVVFLPDDALAEHGRIAAILRY